METRVHTYLQLRSCAMNTVGGELIPQVITWSHHIGIPVHGCSCMILEYHGVTQLRKCAVNLLNRKELTETSRNNREQ